MDTQIFYRIFSNTMTFNIGLCGKQGNKSAPVTSTHIGDMWYYIRTLCHTQIFTPKLFGEVHKVIIMTQKH